MFEDERRRQNVMNNYKEHDIGYSITSILDSVVHAGEESGLTIKKKL